MLGFLKKLGGKKSEEDQSTAPKAKKGKGFFLELDETGNVLSATPEKKPEPAQASAAKVESPEAKTAPKVEQKKSEQTAKASQTKKLEPLPTKAVKASNGKVEPQPGMTFAPNYLLTTSSKPRRRPGPSLDMFKDMARQVKTPGK
ncbi:MAG: hypothetical protein WA919_11645 [Coleofasciculaceae cyanobacterium]